MVARQIVALEEADRNRKQGPWEVRRVVHTPVCGTASLSSILSVPTKARSPNYDLVAHRCYQDSMKSLAGRPFGLAQTIIMVRCLLRGCVDES